jgi:hypothetical protein
MMTVWLGEFGVPLRPAPGMVDELVRPGLIRAAGCEGIPKMRRRPRGVGGTSEGRRTRSRRRGTAASSTCALWLWDAIDQGGDAERVRVLFPRIRRWCRTVRRARRRRYISIRGHQASRLATSSGTTWAPAGRAVESDPSIVGNGSPQVGDIWRRRTLSQRLPVGHRAHHPQKVRTRAPPTRGQWTSTRRENQGRGHDLQGNTCVQSRAIPATVQSSRRASCRIGPSSVNEAGLLA